MSAVQLKCFRKNTEHNEDKKLSMISQEDIVFLNFAQFFGWIL